MKNLAVATNLIIIILSFIGKAFFCGAVAVVVIKTLELGFVWSNFIWLGAMTVLFPRVFSLPGCAEKRS